uniref:Uncharacterized protein n=1 Tax=Oryza sativa subsp. japonica TaxID=39947 RepID=Q6Z455_ORYSJ|nr:hypothetical protein [Oryza sativa Japonica Group]BAD30850.1 hypothetical protein [Oryza sativa Japonica Group]
MSTSRSCAAAVQPVGACHIASALCFFPHAHAALCRYTWFTTPATPLPRALAAALVRPRRKREPSSQRCVAVLSSPVPPAFSLKEGRTNSAISLLAVDIKPASTPPSSSFPAYIRRRPPPIPSSSSPHPSPARARRRTTTAPHSQVGCAGAASAYGQVSRASIVRSGFHLAPGQCPAEHGRATGTSTLVQNLPFVTASNMLEISGRHKEVISIGPKKRPIEIT